MRFSFSALKSIAIVKYLRELSVVVIGVAITLGAGNMLNARQEQQDTANYLNMVKLELETNLKTIKWWTGYMQMEANYSHYLLSHEYKALHPDSLQRYSEYYIGEHTCLFSTAAFEMFKSSGCMRLIKEKNFVVNIWRMYGILDIFQSIVAEYNAAKSAEMIKESMQLRRDGSHAQMLLYDFYTSGRINPEQTLMNSREVVQALQEAITTIEQQMQ